MTLPPPTLRKILSARGRCLSCYWLPSRDGHAPSCGDRELAADVRAGDEMAGAS